MTDHADWLDPLAFARAIDGDWRIAPPTPRVRFDAARIDSRVVQPGEAFFALPGSRSDGHDYLEAAANAGATLLVVERDPPADHLERFVGRAAVLRVASGRAALTRLARAARDHGAGFRRVFAITGSSGKTTTRELLHAALATRLRGRRSLKSFNNQLGVPLTLLDGWNQPLDYRVVEIGTSGPREIGPLSCLTRPHVAILTGIGAAHLGGFPNRTGLVEEKLSLLDGLDPEGEVIAPASLWRDDEVRPVLERRIAEAPPATRWTWTVLPGDVLPPHAPGQTFSCTNIELGFHGVEFTVDGARATAPLPGRHSVSNAMLAWAAASLAGLDAGTITEGLAAVEPAPMRMTPMAMGPPDRPIRVLLDAYNANPESMAAAVEVALTQGGPGRRVLVLGEMRELGEAAEMLHRGVGEKIASLRQAGAGAEPLLLIALGPWAQALADATGGPAPADPDWLIDTNPEPDATLLAEATGRIEPGDIVLIKASRGVELERLTPALRARWPVVPIRDAPSPPGGAGSGKGET